jgi:DNA-binding SARP family transcriptional activator/Tfp pilus assembly protein PilF
MLHLRTFGGLALQRESTALDPVNAQRKAMALLAVLAGAGSRGIGRDKLMLLFWPESDANRARGALKQMLHTLRRLLGSPDVILGTAELRLDPELIESDLTRFRTALEEGEPEAAVALYHGPFLDGVHLDGAPEFDGWLEQQRAELERDYHEALERLACAAEADGEQERAATWWRRLQAADPLNGRVALRLMQALEASGDRAASLRHASVHEALLREELGIAPDPTVTALAERLRSSAAASPPDGASASTPTQTEPAAPCDPDAFPTAPADHERVNWDAGRPAARPEETAAAPPRTRKYRPALLALLVFSGVLSMLAAGEWLGFVQSTLGMEAGESLLAAGTLEERERILLADFENRTADAELAGAVTAALRIDLAQSPLISLVEPSMVREALARMERRDAAGLDLPLARELALREGIGAVLTGDVLPAGTGYVLSARLVAAETGETLTAHRVTATDSTRVIPAIDRLSKQLRLRIGESLRSTRRNPPLEQVTTSSLAALRKYSLAGVALDREGDLPRGLALLEEAIALDSLFAEAYRKLGAHYMNSPFHVQQARLPLSRAYELRERLPDRERYHTIATYHGIVTGERDQAITAYRTLLDQYPDDLGALVVLGLLLGWNREYVQAEQVLRRAVDLQPSWQGFGNLVSVQVALGRFDEARATLETYRRTLPHGPRPLTSATHLAAAQGHHLKAEAHLLELRRTERNPIWRGTTSYWLGLLALIRGQVAEAERYFEDRAAAAEHLEQPGATLSLAAELAGIEAYVRGAPAVGIARLEKALARQPLATLPPHERPYLGLAALYAEAGQPERARHYLSEYEAVVAQSLARKNVQLAEIVRGRIALASRRPEEALRHFRSADESDCPIAVLPDLARAFEVARQPDSAIAAYERYAATATPFSRIRPDAWWLPWTHERLGQLYEARGEQARAADHYRSFIELWKDADAELQPRVREARRRLAALE